MECNVFDLKVHFDTETGKYIIGSVDSYGYFSCRLVPEFDSYEDANNYLKGFISKSNNVICDLCNKDSLCK